MHVVQTGGWPQFKQHQDPIIHGQRLGPECQKHLNQEENSNGLFEEPKLGNARKLRGTCCMDPGDMEFTGQRMLKEVIKEAQKEERTVQFATLMDICHLKKKNGVETKIPKIQGTSVKYDSGTVKYDSGSHAMCAEQGSSASITNDGRKSSGWCSKAVSMRRTSSRCSISLYPGQKWRMLQHCWTHQVAMSRYLDTSTTIHMAKIMVQYGKMQSFLLSEIFTVILGQDHYGKGNSRKFYWNTLEKSSNYGMLICKPSKRSIADSVCGRHQTGWQETKDRTNLEGSHERRRFWAGD